PVGHPALYAAAKSERPARCVLRARRGYGDEDDQADRRAARADLRRRPLLGRHPRNRRTLTTSAIRRRRARSSSSSAIVVVERAHIRSARAWTSSRVSKLTSRGAPARCASSSALEWHAVHQFFTYGSPKFSHVSALPSGHGRASNDS